MKNKLTLSDIKVNRIENQKSLKKIRGGAMGNSGHSSTSSPSHNAAKNANNGEGWQYPDRGN